MTGLFDFWCTQLCRRLVDLESEPSLHKAMSHPASFYNRFTLPGNLTPGKLSSLSSL